MHDVIIIGGGPAGLQAALTLGRMHRYAVLLDSGVYRNDPADAMHNFLTRDGTDPAELRADALREIATYETVEVRRVAATEVSGTEGDFTVTLAEGEPLRARRLLLATGVRDTLPDIPGLPEVFGSAAAHCPFCHGHEYAGGRVVIEGSEHAQAMVLMMAPIAAETVVVDDIVEVRASGDGVVVTRADGTEIDARGLIVKTTYAQSTPFAEQLGLTMLPTGCIEVDGFGRTSLAGVYAAGDLATTAELQMPMASVLNAAANGLLAAASCVRDEVLATLAG
ncbi:thioredoxin reductase [Marmoricola sp. OAE513]|uniref:NAD(P)/FAD-dependent oxidoreductase n=1 Tax=Marmoricola sp. OAE513 TaxID=2817894 RepID=UPI001AE60439